MSSKDEFDIREEYYSKLWSTPEWGDKSPNNDELLRLGAILVLLDSTRSQYKNGVLTILDLGCGRGWLTAQLANRGTIMGIDPTSSAIEVAKNLFPHLNFQVNTAEGLNKEGFHEHFDVVVCSEVIEHVLDAEKENFIKAIASVCKSGGLVILTTPRGEMWKQWVSLGCEKQPVEDWCTEGQLDRFANCAGLKLLLRKRVGLDIIPTLWTRIHYRVRRFTLISKLFDLFRGGSATYQVVLYRKS